MKGVKQLPGGEQPGNKDPSACRKVLGPIRKLKKKNIILQVPAVCGTGSADSTLAKCMAEEDRASTQS